MKETGKKKKKKKKKKPLLHITQMNSQLLFAALGLTSYALLSIRKQRTKKMSTTSCTQEGGDCGCVTPAPAWRGPVAPKAGPVPKELAPGTSAWLCTCGESKNYPFCDGSHRAFNQANGTSYAPREYKNSSETETVTAYLCACGKTKNPTGHCESAFYLLCSLFAVKEESFALVLLTFSSVLLPIFFLSLSLPLSLPPSLSLFLGTLR